MVSVALFVGCHCDQDCMSLDVGGCMMTAGFDCYHHGEQALLWKELTTERTSLTPSSLKFLLYGGVTHDRPESQWCSKTEWKRTEQTRHKTENHSEMSPYQCPNAHCHAFWRANSEGKQAAGEVVRKRNVEMKAPPPWNAPSPNTILGRGSWRSPQARKSRAILA